MCLSSLFPPGQSPGRGRLGAPSLMEEWTTLLGVARPSATAVSKHQLSSLEDTSCSAAGSFCCPRSCGWEGFASRTAWVSMVESSPLQVLSAQVLSASVDA